MGTITLDFIGLFLFNASDPDTVRIAVIDADRNEVDLYGKTLNPHKASFVAENVLDPDWPRTKDGHFELVGDIVFDTSPQQVDKKRWALPRIATGCRDMLIEDSFFETSAPGATHAVIAVRSGELCGWRFPPPPGKKGAINTRITITNPDHFIIRRVFDQKHIELNVAEGSHVIFTNTERQMTLEDRDWYWYYIATGRKDCASEPHDEEAIAPCAPPDLDPLSIGCSNSQWP